MHARTHPHTHAHTDSSQPKPRRKYATGTKTPELTQQPAETGAHTIHALHHFEPGWKTAEDEVAAISTLVLHHGNQLAPPDSILSGSGGRYRVFTPWWRQLLSHMPPPRFGTTTSAATISWPACCLGGHNPADNETERNSFISHTRDDMNFEPTEEQKAIVAQVRRFVREEIVPLEEKLDPDASELPEEDRQRLVAKVKAMGLYGLDIPAEYGGPGIDMTTRVLLAIEMGQHRAGIYVPCYGVFGTAGLAQLYEATEEQKEKYLRPMLRGEKRGFFGLTEPSGGSDPARAIRTRATKTNDGWVINGSKVFISGADKD